MVSGLFHFNSVDQFISISKGVWLIFIIIVMFIEISVFNASSVDPDQMRQHLIWVCTVCQCPFYGMLGINVFKSVLADS